MSKKLLIIGSGGHGKVCADIALKMNKWEYVAFLDDNSELVSCLDLNVIGKISDAQEYKECSDFFVAIGNNRLRGKTLDNLFTDDYSVVNLVHPNAIIGTNSEIGLGTVVMAGVVINSCTMIGKGCIINTSSSIDHDNLIDDYVHIAPGAHTSGMVKIGQGSLLGIGCLIANNVSIGSNCILGAGTVVIKDINESGTYVGVPARKVK